MSKGIQLSKYYQNTSYNLNKYNFINQMTEQIKYLKSNPEISDVIAEGFAHIYHQKPQFPITFLANFLRSHEQLKLQKKQLAKKIGNNVLLSDDIKRQEERKLKEKEALAEKIHHQKQREEGFQFRIKECLNHEEILNEFCEWIEKQKKLTGVYIGQLESQWKKIDLEQEDSQQVHIDTEAPKIIKFKAASHSHNKLMIGKTLSQESVLGKLLSEKPEEAGGQEQEGKQKQQQKPQGQIYIPFVQENKQLTFFKYPKLGSFYALAMKVKTYLHQKIFDTCIVKTQTYKKANEEYQKQHEERQNKFKALYDQRTAQGADEKELEQLEQNYEKQQQNFPKPKMEEFQFVLRQFVICFDTLGIDREISLQERNYCRNQVQILKHNWEFNQRLLLKRDIDSQLKLLSENIQVPQQEALTKLVQEEDKQLPSHEEVEKVKTNEKLVQLQINTLRLEKIKQYMVQQKYFPYLDILLDRRVIKFPQIIKIFYLFAGFSKEDVTVRGTNILNWLKTRALLTKEQILQKFNHFVPRGSKPNEKVKPYAKWQRVIKILEKYDLNNVASYNIFLAFILRFLLISGKVRIADSEARKASANIQRAARQQRIKQFELKKIEKQQKLRIAIAEAQGKEQVFDEQAWIKLYQEQNQLIEIGEEIIDEIDKDLQEIVVQAASQ